MSLVEGPSEGLEDAHKLFFQAYVELFQRRMTVHAFQNGYYGTELPELALIEVIEEITAKMRIDCKLTDDQHEVMKGRLLKLVFGARNKTWVKK